MLSYTGVGLAVDNSLAPSGQLLLGGLTWIALAAALTQVSPEWRIQVVFVVAIATAGEALASLVLGLYTYRLDNLPLFVPPGHGLVFIAGLSLATMCAKRRGVLVALAVAGVGLWGVVGVTMLAHPDVAGVFGAIALALVLLWTRRAAYAGMFVVVAALELYGTAVGAWTWAAAVPHTAVPMANPPSGVASGYVLLDIAAAAAATCFGKTRGADQIRTGVRGFAGLCLTTRPRRRGKPWYPGRFRLWLPARVSRPATSR